MLPYSLEDVNADHWDPKEFLAALNSIFKWKEKDVWHNISFLQEYMWLLLIPNTKLEKWLFIYWSGGNGKWVLASAITAMLWENNCSNVWVAELGDKQFRYSVFWKLVNIDTDLFADTILDREYVKKIISWESIIVKRMYQQPFKINPFSRLIVLANQMPRVKLLNKAIVRRFFFMEFKNYFGDTWDTELKTKIAGEYKQIFWWALKGLQRLMANWWSFTLPKQLQINEKRCFE